MNLRNLVISKMVKSNLSVPGCWLQWRRKDCPIVRPFEKNLNLTIIGPTRTLKIQGFDCKCHDFWFDQGRNGHTVSAGSVLINFFVVFKQRCSLFLVYGGGHVVCNYH